MLTTIWLALALQPASIAMHTIPNLPPAIVRAVFAGLCGLLPPPGTDTAEARADRDELAMAAVAALHPADAFEADLAVQIVGANAHAKDSLRLAAAAGQDVWEARRCRAQAAVMMRHMQSGLRALERRQQTREKAEDAMHPAAMGRAGWWFHEASVPPPEPAPAQTEASAPVTGRADREVSELTEAEQYALLHPRRAARIRAAGGLPHPLDFGPPEPAIVEALVHGTSAILLALDQHTPEAAEA
jgi:hypothetical protein